jgi:hypothetical protein
MQHEMSVPFNQLTHPQVSTLFNLFRFVLRILGYGKLADNAMLYCAHEHDEKGNYVPTRHRFQIESGLTVSFSDEAPKKTQVVGIGAVTAVCSGGSTCRE